MTRTRPSRARPEGFTLLELLIAVMAFAIVLGAINAVFYTALRLRNKTTQAVEDSLPLQHAVRVIGRDLANVVPPGGTLSGELKSAQVTPDMIGQVSPDFYTTSGVLDHTSPFAQVQKVSYYLLESTNAPGSKDLYRVVTRNLLPTIEEQPVPEWLLGRVRTVAFLFLKGTAWQDTWDSSAEETVMPAAIKVQIEMETDRPADVMMEAPVEIVVPVTVQSRTNQTQQASGGQP
jgi:type II secretion system protein J